MPADDMCQ